MSTSGDDIYLALRYFHSLVYTPRGPCRLCPGLCYRFGFESVNHFRVDVYTIVQVAVLRQLLLAV